MGAWSFSITGNDTAQDLIYEYKLAFAYYSLEEAVERLDKYCEKEFSEDEIHEYYYSLASFMWQYGILTKEVKDRAINWIDNGKGLELWEEDGGKFLKKRKAVLQKFKEKLNSQMPAKKKLKQPETYLSFKLGDMIALQLLEKYEGYYIVIKKIYSNKNLKSSIVPDMYEEQSFYVLYDYFDENLPNSEDIKKMKILDIVSEADIGKFFSAKCLQTLNESAKRIVRNFPDMKHVFQIGLGTAFHWKKRKYQVICNDLSDCEKAITAIQIAKSDDKYFLSPDPILEMDFDEFILRRFQLNDIINVFPKDAPNEWNEYKKKLYEAKLRVAILPKETELEEYAKKWLARIGL